MRFAWGKAALAAAIIALGACGRGDDAATLEAQARAAEAFMTANKAAEGVIALPSGLQYKVVRSGPTVGESPDRNDLVSVNYEGALADGTVFDSSFDRGTPYVTTPERVVPGWTEALQRMKVGDEWLLYVPPGLGYGEQGGPPTIPPNAVLVFRVQLLDVAQAPGGGRGVGLATG